MGPALLILTWSLCQSCDWSVCLVKSSTVTSCWDLTPRRNSRNWPLIPLVVGWGWCWMAFAARTRLSILCKSLLAAEVVILAAGLGPLDQTLCQMTSLVMSEWGWGGAGGEERGCRSADDAGCWNKVPAMDVKPRNVMLFDLCSLLQSKISPLCVIHVQLYLCLTGLSISERWLDISQWNSSECDSHTKIFPALFCMV